MTSKEAPSPKITIREMQQHDVAPATALLNEIIEIGGTTAYVTPLSVEEFEHKFTHYPRAAWLVALTQTETDQEVLLGFQWIALLEGEEGVADIATFVSPLAQGQKIGPQLFTRTLSEAVRLGYHTINATIRADNIPGLRYYTGLGFKDFAKAKDAKAVDGTPLPRVSKRYNLSEN